MVYAGMNILGIETSCDETAVAVACEGPRILSNVVFSQVSAHQPYGGVVPEIASRNHLIHLPEILKDALMQSSLAWRDLNGIAVTYGPGLASSLLVGLSTAKALALRLGLPLIGVNHLEAHLYSAFLSSDAPSFTEFCPFIALIVSGGHTCLLRIDRPGQYQMLGSTLDDAAGEALDKGANLLGLGYPGGPAIEQAGSGGNPHSIRFPRAHLRRNMASCRKNPELSFSFSGLKTALLYYIKGHPENCAANAVCDIAASYQEAVFESLLEPLRLALIKEKLSHFSVVGGVSINQNLRQRLKHLASSTGSSLLLAPPDFCIDNAAMVAAVACAGEGISGDRAWALDASPNLDIGI